MDVVSVPAMIIPGAQRLIRSKMSEELRSPDEVEVGTLVEPGKDIFEACPACSALMASTSTGFHRFVGQDVSDKSCRDLRRVRTEMEP